jgi:YD repeat-containing protein
MQMKLAPSAGLVAGLSRPIVQTAGGAFNIGHLTTAANAAATCQYSYDELGRQFLRSWTLPDATHYSVAANYDTGGRILSMEYKSDPKVVLDMWIMGTAYHCTYSC